MYNKARHSGTLGDWQPKEQTTEMPKVFVEWVNDNKSRWQANGKAAPFFIRDNYQQGDVDKGLDTRITAAIEEAKLAAATATAKAEEPKKAEPKPAPFHRATLEELKAAGIKVQFEEEYKNSFAENSGFDFVEFKQQMENVAESLDLKIDEFLIIPDEKEFEFAVRLKNKDGKTAIRLSRKFYKTGNKIECYHAGFTIDPSLQGKGISEQVFAKLYAEYQRMGVDVLTVDANLDVGGYTWTRYGFTADSGIALDYAIEFQEKTKSREMWLKWEEFYNTHNEKTPFPMNLFSEVEGAKDFFAGRKWKGVLDLRNAEQTRVFKEYIGVEKANNRMAMKGTEIVGKLDLTTKQQYALSAEIKDVADKCGLFNKNITIDYTAHTDGVLMSWDEKGNRLTVSLTKRKLPDGTEFCPAEHIKSAIAKLKAGQPLTFNEEYTIECLFHENVHSLATGIIQIKENSLNEIIFETCTQLFARSRYNSILDKFGVEAINYKAIQTGGLGYQRACNILRKLFTKDEILQVGELKAVANKTISGEDMLKTLCRKRGYNFEQICKLLKATIAE